MEGNVIELFDEYGDHFKMYFKYVQNYPKISMDLAGENLTSKTVSLPLQYHFPDTRDTYP